MSISLYYTAKRELLISKQEQDACQKVVEDYITKYPLGDMYESFCVYDQISPIEENVIFEGATKLPVDEGEDHFLEVLDYWSDCLQKIINLLPCAQWYIHIDDVDITTYFSYPE